MSYDLTPLRPWEMAQADAYQWTEAEQIQHAFRAAVREVDAEAAAIGGPKANAD